MEAVLGSVVEPVVQCVTDSTSSKYRIFRKFRRNLGALRKDVGELKLLKSELEAMLNSADKEGKLPTPRVTAWLKDVEAIEAEVNTIEEEVTSNESSFHGCCQNVRLRYRLSKQAMEKSEDVKRLISRFQTDQLVEITFTPLKAVEPIPAPTSITGQTAALDQLLNLLKDDEVGMIGVWGMGGVGKTTLLQNLNNKLHHNCSHLAQPFDMVIWVTVSKDLDVRNIQSQVANRLNFHGISAEDSTERRAIRLLERLNKEKFLLILDDVWAKVDLCEVGIPRVPGCKIILTTRSLDVCSDIGTDKDIQVGIPRVPNLTSICPLSSTIETLPNLKTIEVSYCPLLKELPQNASTIIGYNCPLLIKEGHLSSTQNERTTKGEIKGDPCSSSSSGTS